MSAAVIFNDVTGVVVFETKGFIPENVICEGGFSFVCSEVDDFFFEILIFVTFFFASKTTISF